MNTTASRAIPRPRKLDEIPDRRQLLAPLEGRTVTFHGMVTAIRNRPEGGWYACMSEVEIHPFDPAVAEKNSPEILIDHLWVEWKGEEPPSTTILRNMVGSLGTVHWYAKADGTVNLGISQVPGLTDRCLAEAIGKLKRLGLPHWEELIHLEEILGEFEKEHARGRFWCLARHVSPEEDMRVFRDFVTRQRRSWEREKATLMSGFFPGGPSRSERRKAEKEARRRRGGQ